MNTNHIYTGDCLTGMIEHLPDNSIDCCVTSPPYFGLRDYCNEGQIGLEETPDAYIAKLVAVFAQVRRALKPDGTLWVNISDTYQKKSLIGIPWMLAFALRADGWYLRSEIIWHKLNPMPESVTDRPTKSHEQLFLLTKSPTYYYDHEAIKEKAVQFGKRPGGVKYSSDAATPAIGKNHTKATLNDKLVGEFRNKRSVWSIPTKGTPDAHFATYPPDLIIPCIKAGCPVGGIVLDPFMGAGTTGIVAANFSRKYIGFELNSDYVTISNKRIEKKVGGLIALF